MIHSTRPTPVVLLVDDDPSHLKLYSWILTRGGFRAVTALVGSSSVAFPTVTNVDLAVMDYRLSSQLTGPDIAKHIREQFPSVPIVLISELLWMPDDMRGLVDGFVTKGEPDQLLDKIDELLPGSDAGQGGGSGTSKSHD